MPEQTQLSILVIVHLLHQQERVPPPYLNQKWSQFSHRIKPCFEKDSLRALEVVMNVERRTAERSRLEVGKTREGVICCVNLSKSKLDKRSLFSMSI